MAVFIAIFLVLVFVLQAPFDFISYENKSVYQNGNILADTLAENSNFGDVPINKIALLGSHDAFSYGINYSSIPNSSEDNFSNSFWASLAKGLVSRLSKAQAHDVTTQLNAGVRYFDARITLVNGEYYTSHGVLSVKLKDVLTDIINFCPRTTVSLSSFISPKIILNQAVMSLLQSILIP